MTDHQLADRLLHAVREGDARGERPAADAGAGRGAATNQWDEPPEELASPRVAALLRAHTAS